MPLPKSELSVPARAGYYLSNLLIAGTINLFRLLPYRHRIPAVGWLTAHILAPAAGFRRRIRDNLSLVMPELSEDEVHQLCLDVADNAGRMIMEFYSTDEFRARAVTAPLSGPGFAALAEAQAAGRPVILATAHFGDYEAARSRVAAEGYQIGALYRRMANPYFNDHYTAAMRTFGEPVFEQGRRGMVNLVRYLKGGGIVGILNDLHAHGGAELTFFGKPAVTSLIMAELALKYDALLLPIYAVRQANGLDFEVQMHAPIPHTDAETMTQAVNDGLEALVRQNMGQWFWVHRRWKPWFHLGIQPEDDEA